MKICLVCRRVNKTGGISRYVYELCKYLLRFGHEVHLFTNHCDAKNLHGIQLHYIPMIEGKFFERRKKIALAKMFQVWSFAIASWVLVNPKQFDIVHVQGDSFVRAQIRSAHSCHKTWLIYKRSKSKGLINSILKSALNPLHFIALLIEKLNYGLGNVEKIISVSSAVSSEIHLAYGTPLDKIVAIENGVDLEAFSPRNATQYRNECREQYGIGKKDFVVVFVGHEFERKGLDTVIDVINDLKNNKIHLFVVGGDKDEKYTARVRALELTRQAHFVGLTNEVKRYYAASDVFLLPASYEPFGLVVTEAMASGLPVIVSSNTGAASMIVNGKNGFLIDLNNAKSEAVACISRLMDSPGLRESVSIESRKTAEMFSWESMARRTEKVYLEMLHG